MIRNNESQYRGFVVIKEQIEKFTAWNVTNFREIKFMIN